MGHINASADEVLQIKAGLEPEEGNNLYGHESVTSKGNNRFRAWGNMYLHTLDFKPINVVKSENELLSTSVLTLSLVQVDQINSKPVPDTVQVLSRVSFVPASFIPQAPSRFWPFFFVCFVDNTVSVAQVI